MSVQLPLFSVVSFSLTKNMQETKNTNLKAAKALNCTLANALVALASATAKVLLVTEFVLDMLIKLALNCLLTAISAAVT